MNCSQVLLLEGEDGAVDEGFLWEQITSSLDQVELYEVRRVVGEKLVQSCEDIYAEVRALREIVAEYSAATDGLVDGQQPQISSSAAGLVALEVQQLAGFLKSRAAAAGN